MFSTIYVDNNDNQWKGTDKIWPQDTLVAETMEFAEKKKQMFFFLWKRGRAKRRMIRDERRSSPETEK